MTVKKIHWDLMSWTEVREAQKQNPVVLVPAGTSETHGPQTFVGLEWRMAVRLGEEVARQTNALVTPPITFGYSSTFQDIPGTISLRPDTLTALYEDVARAILKHGFDHVLFLAMHIPNQPMLRYVADKLRDELGVLIAWINPANMWTAALKQVAPNYPQAARGHGASGGLSIAKYLAPDMVDLSTVRPNRSLPEYQGLKLEGTMATFQGHPLNLAMRFQDISPEDGGQGDPSFASEELGKAMFEYVVEQTRQIVDRFAAVNTHVARPGE